MPAVPPDVAGEPIGNATPTVERATDFTVWVEDAVAPRGA